MKKYGRERLKRIIEETGMPKTAKFKGYVLHLPESDEFMAMAENIGNYGLVNYMWVKNPDMALIFKKHIKAVRELQDYDKNEIRLCLIFDVGTQYLVLSEESALEILGLK